MKLYQVIILNSGEAILDADVVIRTFDNLGDAKRVFKIETEAQAEFFKERVEGDERKYKEILREDSEFCKTWYDDDGGFASKVELIETELGSVAAVSF